MRRKQAEKYGVDIRYFLPRIPHLKVNITYRCDRCCPNCNRATKVCPSSKDEDLTPKQFANIMDECVKEEKGWTKITLTGGEPTMHDKFEEFVDILMQYKKNYNSELRACVFTYHHPKYFKKIEWALKKYPDFIVNDSDKKVPRIHKMAIYKAPIDDPKRFKPDHFYRGCPEGARLCGIGYDTSGFYCCPIAPTIARVFGVNVAIKTVKDLTIENLVKQYKPLCSMCGEYAYYKAKINKDIISDTWERAIKKYNARD